MAELKEIKGWGEVELIFGKPQKKEENVIIGKDPSYIIVDECSFFSPEVLEKLKKEKDNEQ